MGSHPLTTAVEQVRAQIADLDQTPLWTLDDTSTRATLTELTALAAQVAALELKVATHAHRNDAHDGTGATSVAAWWAIETHQTRAAAYRKIAFGGMLDTYDLTATALAQGSIQPDQAAVILDAVKALPEEVTAEIRVKAEKHLLTEAQHHDAKALRILGRRILEVLDPAAADAAEAKALENEEAEAQAAARLSMHDDGHGKTYGRFTIPSLQAAILRKHLLALAAPKHQTAASGAGNPAADEPAEPRPSAEKLGRAFCEFLERYPVDRTPHSGGVSATVVVTMTLESLLGGLSSAVLDNGDRLSATTARRLACEAAVIPVVLGTKGEVLDLGRRVRLHTKAQRIALGVQQGGCMARGCDRPPSMCHTHHRTPWSRGGGTSTHDAVLLCPRHHTLIHREPQNVPLRT